MTTLEVRVAKGKPEGKKRKKRISDEKVQKVVKLVSGEVDPNFELPFMGWPEGDKDQTDRALILMLAGIELLEKQYPKKASEPKPDQSSSEKHASGVNKPLEDWL